MIDSTLEYVQGMETIKAYRLEQSGKLMENQVDGYCTASDRYESTLMNWSMGYKICLNLGLFLSLGVGITMIRSGSLAPATYLFLQSWVLFLPSAGSSDGFLCHDESCKRIVG